MNKTVTIAFSGEGNTGKTSLMHGYRDSDGSVIKSWLHDILTQDFWLKVKTYDEIARQNFNLLEKEGFNSFQQALLFQECERVKEITGLIKDNIYDVLLLDRTPYDQYAYLLQNIIQNKVQWNFDFQSINKHKIDKIIFLEHGMKESKQFEHYHKDLLVPEIMKALITSKYKSSVEVYRNAEENWEDIHSSILAFLRDKGIISSV